MRIFVGNLAYATTKELLTEAFAAYGEVNDVHLPMDRATGRPRGFAFVTMNSDEQGKAAIEAMNGKEIDGRQLAVNEARPREEGGGGGGGRPSGEGGGGFFGRRPGRGGGGGGGGREQRPRGDNRSRRPSY